MVVKVGRGRGGKARRERGRGGGVKRRGGMRSTLQLIRNRWYVTSPVVNVA